MADKQIKEFNQQTTVTSSDKFLMQDASDETKYAEADDIKQFAQESVYRFYAYRNAAATTGAGAFATIVYDTEVYDTNSNFNTASGVYTAPIDGLYMFSAQSRIGTDAHIRHAIQLVTSNATYRGQDLSIAAGPTASSVVVSVPAHMEAGDTAYIQVLTETGAKNLTVGGSSFNYFVGCLVSRY